MNIERQAEHLAQSSLNADGLLDLQRVRAAVEYIETRAAKGRRLELMRLYKKRVALLLSSEEARVEYAGKPSEETVARLKEFLRARAGKKVEVRLRENPRLLAGVKLVCGNDIWENSLRADLDALAKGLGAQT